MRVHTMDETEYERLLAAAIRFVSFRPRSEKELRDFCAKTLKHHHTTAPIVVERVLVRMKDYGYVDDKKFTEWWVGQRTSFKPKGKRMIAMELRAKGIHTPEITIDERALARKAVERKLVIWKTLPLTAKKKKLYDFLFRRGFDADTVGSVVDDITGKE